MEDAPAVADLNKTDINGDPMDTVPVSDESTPVDTNLDNSGDRGPGAPRKPGLFEESPKPTAGPQIRAPRRQHAQHRKWNADTRRQKMREYMQQYRGTGKINDRKTQTRGA
jgi:hypothetical protein